jgi:hypothetical protein
MKVRELKFSQIGMIIISPQNPGANKSQKNYQFRGSWRFRARI